MPDRPLILFAGGGTGGHVFPAVAVAEQLADGSRADVMMLCTERDIDSRILMAAEIEFATQSVRPFPRQPWHWPAFYRAWRRSYRQAAETIRRRQPAVVVGTGGYASGPAIRAAYNRHVHTALLNPDLLPGRANRFCGRYADAVFVQWPATAKFFHHVSLVKATGCPIRRAFARADRGVALRAHGLSADRRTLLVTGASQGANTINRAVVELADLIAGMTDWQVLHLAGAADAGWVRDRWAARCDRAVVIDFTHDIADAFAAADLVISRAGANTLAELTALGRPSILLPYPYGDRHQRHNAEVLGEAGAAIVLGDRIDPLANAEQLAPLLRELAGYPERLTRMAVAARRLGRPAAARDVADALLELAGVN